MPGIDYGAARALLPLADVLALLGRVPHRRYGTQLRGSCPLHHSRSATSRSFAAHLGKNAWHCFGCGAGATPWTCGPPSRISRCTRPCSICVNAWGATCRGRHRHRACHA